MHQALLSLTSPFPLYCFTNGKTAIVLLLLLLLLLCSDAPLRCSSTQHTSSVPLLMSHHHPIRPLLFVSTAVNEWSSASVTVRGSADNQPVLGVYRPPCSRSERSKAKRSEAKRSVAARGADFQYRRASPSGQYRMHDYPRYFGYVKHIKNKTMVHVHYLIT